MSPPRHEVDEIQIVAILPGGQFLGLGLIEVDNIDALIAFLASRDELGGRAITPSDVRRAFDQARDAQRRADTVGNNDADDDGA